MALASATNIHARLTAAVDQLWTDEIAFLQQLVSFPSLRGQEGPCQDFLARAFAAR